MKLQWYRNLIFVYSVFIAVSVFAKELALDDEYEEVGDLSLVTGDDTRVVGDDKSEFRPQSVFNNNFGSDGAEFDRASQEAGITPLTKQLVESREAKGIGPEVDTTQEPMTFGWGNLTGKFQIKFRPESFVARNANLLNNNNRADFVQFSRSTIDVNFGLDYGKKCYGYNIVDFFMTMRNKCVWGNPESMVRATLTKIKTLESLDSGHVHFITRQLFWVRELWLNFNVNEVFNLSFNSELNFMLGAFPLSWVVVLRLDLRMPLILAS